MLKSQFLYKNFNNAAPFTYRSPATLFRRYERLGGQSTSSLVVFGRRKEPCPEL
jgi:hypothetical protein